MLARAAAVARWTLRILVAFGLLLVLAAALLWWWTGQEGSLDWVLQRASRGVPLQSEGVRGSLRGGWHIDRLVWERDGLRVEVEDIRLRWQPIAILERTLRLDEVSVGRARVVDARPRNDEPLQEPAQLRLPWRVNVDTFKVATLAYEGRVALTGGNLQAQYAFDGLRHHLSLASLQLADGTYRGELSLLAIAPLTLDAAASGRFAAPLPGAAPKLPLELAVRAQGPLRELQVEGRLRVPPDAAKTEPAPSATVRARIAPFSGMPVPEATADLQQLDVALFWPAAPRTQLSGHVEVTPAAKNAWRLQADLRNAVPGPWDRQRLPVETLRATGEWRDGKALVESLAAQAAGGRVEGSGHWQGAGWTFDGALSGVDPAQIYSTVAPLPITGPVKLSGEGAAVAFDVDLRAGAPLSAAAGALELRDLLAQGRWSGDTLAVKQMRLRTSDASLEGEGEWQPRAQAGQARVQLRAPGLQANADGTLSETRGQGELLLTAADLAQAQRWLARWPGLDQAFAGITLRGDAKAQVAWQGGWRDPALQTRADVHSLAWQEETPDVVPWVVRDATVQARGRLHDAAVDLHGQAAQGQRTLDLSAAGRVGATQGDTLRWQGQVATLTAQWLDPAAAPGPWRITLRRAVTWQAATGHFELTAGEALLQSPGLRSGTAPGDAVLSWGPLRHERGQLSTTGRVAGLPLAWIELFGGPQLAGSALSSDMVFDAQWNAQLGPTTRVEASLVRVRGDVLLQAESADGSPAHVKAGVRDARLVVTAQGEQVELQLLWDSERAGHAVGQVRSRIVRDAQGNWSWPAQAPLSGRVQAQLPRIGVWSVLAPPGWRLRGSLTADIQVAGTRANPSLSGPLLANDLALRSVVDGIELRNGRLRAQLAGQRVILNEFLLHGSPEGGSDGGTLLAQGEGHWTPQGAVVEVEAQLSELRASIRADRQLTVSGVVGARMNRSGTEVNGSLRVDRARIQIPNETPPRLADDVVVRNAPGLASPDAERRQESPAGGKLRMRIAFDLGPDFRLSGRGVDTRLTGNVEVRNSEQGLPELVGVIRTAGGTFEAFGERMNIDRGELRFTGPPENPALDILAVRPNMIQKVGVQVSGRAQAPHIELYSDAGLSDAETLNYLVLGRSSAGSGADTAMLQRAATALLAGKSGAGGTGTGIAGRLGLDELSVAPDSTSGGAVVRLGRRFADNLYASYERSLSGAMGTLFLFYDISRRVTLRAEAGERTGVDVIFTFSFDSPEQKK
jgi:translocation and assembly module TamB